MSCHICNNDHLEYIRNYEQFFRITSDCKPWKKKGELCVCKSCGSVQKQITKKYLLEIDTIYNDYSIYYQGGGHEQAIFDPDNGTQYSRSYQFIKKLKNYISLSEFGKILDIGCGNANLLRSFNSFFPNWSLYGSELNKKSIEEIGNIKKLKKIYTCKIDEISNKFNLILLNNVLEHIINPIEYLQTVNSILDDDGFLVCQTPNFILNPFDLIVADHCSHFNNITLERTIINSGFHPIHISTKFFKKELTVIATKNCKQKNKSKNNVQHDDIMDTIVVIERLLKWLSSIIKYCEDISTKCSLGLFGTSNAAIWLYTELNNRVSFFVDEDYNRIKKKILGIKVYHPDEAPKKSIVYIAMPEYQAKEISQRICKPNYCFVDSKGQSSLSTIAIN